MRAIEIINRSLLLSLGHQVLTGEFVVFWQVGEYQGAYKVLVYLCASRTMRVFDCILSIWHTAIRSPCMSTMLFLAYKGNMSPLDLYRLPCHDWQFGEDLCIWVSMIGTMSHYSLVLYDCRWQRGFCRSLGLTVCWTLQLQRLVLLNICRQNIPVYCCWASKILAIFVNVACVVCTLLRLHLFQNHVVWKAYFNMICSQAWKCSVTTQTNEDFNHCLANARCVRFS